MATPFVADRLFEARHLMLASGNLDEVVESCTRTLRPHRLLMRGKSAKLATRLHHVQIGQLSLNRLRYGGDVTVAPFVPEEDNFLITLPLHGAARFHYGNASTEVEPHRGAIVGPYREFRFDIDSRFDQIVLRLDRRRVEAVCAGLSGAETIAPVNFELALTDMPNFWNRLLEAAASLSASGVALSHPRLFVHLEELIIETLLLSQPNNFTSIVSTDGDRTHSRQVRRAMEHMREHIAEPLRMSEVARACGLSLRSLQVGFQRDLGISPRQWLREQRLERVHATLSTAPRGSVTVTDVALQWGFFHLGEFAAHFKARFGEKPSDVLAKPRG
ncbi:MAG: AraC family transcriptional regulator [Xanthobacteraceae bacterium]